MGKKLTKVLVLAVAMLFVFSSVAMAAMPNGTVVLGDKAFDLNYANNPANGTEIDAAYQQALVTANGKVYVKDFGGNLVDNATQSSVSSSVLPQVTYKDANGNVKVYAAGDGDEVTQPGELKIDSVTPVSATKVEVKFNQAVDSASAENFTIQSVTVDAATQNVNDKSIVDLTISGALANKEYTLVVSGLKIGGELQPDMTATFTMPVAEQLYHVVVTSDNPVIKADGASRALITAKITDAEGNLLEDAEDVVIAFTTTFGNISSRVAVENGVATTILSSEYSETNVNAIVNANIIEAANKDLIGIGNSVLVVMSPNPDQGTIEGKPVLTSAEANQADRITLYFDRDVDPSYFVDETGSLKEKIVFEVTNKGKTLDALTVKGVPGNSKALELILDKNDDDFPLVDNSSVTVTFTDSANGVEQASYASFILTDARRPEMLSVTYENLKTLKVKFSEPVNDASATKLSNWSIDGDVLNNDYDITVGDYNPKDGSDTRNTVTISYTNGYFKAGKHSIQAANIGDWAALSDSKNIATTQTIDFVIPEDTTKPVASVDVQSPEQFLVDFNKDVAVQGIDNTTFVLEKEVDNEWTVADNVYYTVTPVDNDKFIVELTQDWTQIYNTAVSHKNYYNDSYRLHIVKDKVENLANGMKNDDQYIELAGPLSGPDVTSPTIDDIIDSDNNVTGDSFIVTMSEPVKLPDKDNAGDTPSQKQGNSIPTPTAEFIKADNSVTVPGTVDGYVGDYDDELEVIPDETLDAGDWTIVIRSISDDVGNTASSATKNFSVAAAPGEKEDFYVVSADVYGANDNTADYINVKFSKPVSVSGDSINALKVTNYKVNGDSLPVGTQIVANEYEYNDDGDKVGVVGIQIIMPNGTLNDSNNVLNVSNYLKSKDGDDLIGDYELVLPYTAE